MRITAGTVIAAALLVLVPGGNAWAEGVDVVGVDNVSTPEPCLVGDLSVAPVDSGLFYTGFTITNPSVTTGCADYTRWIYVRVIYDATADMVPDGAFYMTVPAEAYSSAPLGTFGGKPAIYADHGYKTKVLLPPLKATTTFLFYYGMVNSKRDEIVP